MVNGVGWVTMTAQQWNNFTVEQWLSLTVDGTETDSWGMPAGSYETGQTVWASVEPASGKEAVASEGIQASRQYRVKMRYNPGVDTDCRILWNNHILEIVSVLDVGGRHRELDLIAVEHLIAEAV